MLSEHGQRYRPGQTDTAGRRPQRWADLPEEERRRRQSQSDSARQQAAQRAASLETALFPLPPQRETDRIDARRVELEHDETLQAMWNTVENGGYDFMSKDDW